MTFNWLDGGLTKRVTLPGSLSITNEYDGLGWLWDTQFRNGTTILNRHGYAYNAGHQRTTLSRTQEMTGTTSISPHALNSTAYYHADGNGNITYLLRSDAAANASYRCDPFGRLLGSSGSLAAANVTRFSSKPILLSSQGTWGDYYYGYRFYDPESQRWLNRDPIEENGGMNLYTFVGSTLLTRLMYSDFSLKTPVILRLVNAKS